MASEIPPTGYSRTDLPFYQELDDSQFEAFCLALLNAHPKLLCHRNGQVVVRRVLDAQRSLSGSDQRGADLRAEVQGGEVWTFQCKRVKDFRRSDVEKAIDLLENGFPNADTHVLITTCGLSNDAQEPIRDRPNWLWWDSSRLTSLAQHLRPLEDAMALVHRFFRQEWVQRLFPWGDQPLLTWEEFFARDLAEASGDFHHRTPLLERPETLDQLEAFARSGAGRALILSAAGGQGKSRLLLELGRRLAGSPENPRIRFLNLRREELTESQADFLGRQRDLVLVVDDAHRLGKAIEEIAKAVSDSQTVRLLISTRPQATEATRSQLYRGGYADRIEAPLHLPNWAKAEMITLAERSLDDLHRIQAPRLADLADRCPLLVILGADRINQGSIPETLTDSEGFRERIFRGFIDDFLARHPEAARDRLRTLIRCLSFISPSPKEPAVFQSLGALVGTSPIQIAEDIESLQGAGLIVENQEGIRLYPDLLADAVLLDACTDQGGRPSYLTSAVLSTFPTTEFPALLRNLAQADWDARMCRGARASLFTPVWGQFRERFEKANNADRTKLLEQWSTFSIFQPELTLELAQISLRSAARDGTPFPGSLPSLLEPLVVWHPTHAHAAMDLLWSLNPGQELQQSKLSSGSIETIARAASFSINRPMSAVESVLTWLEKRWAEPETLQRLQDQPELVSALLSPFFERDIDHRWWSSPRTLKFAACPIDPEKSRSLRRRALHLVGILTTSTDLVLCHAAIPTLKKALAPVRGRYGLSPQEDLIPRWRVDRMDALGLVEETLRVHKESNSVVLRLRSELLRRIGFDGRPVKAPRRLPNPDTATSDPVDTIHRDPKFAEACQRTLAAIPMTLNLRVARALHSRAYEEMEVDITQDKSPGIDVGLRHWSAESHRVAMEITETWQAPSEAISFIAQTARALRKARIDVTGTELFHALASTSATWCSVLLDWLLTDPTDELVHLLPTVLRQAEARIPTAYQQAYQSLPTNPSVPKTAEILNALAWQFLHGRGLNADERRAILEASNRKEPRVIATLAQLVWTHFSKEPGWANSLLLRLIPNDETSAEYVLRALATLAESPSASLPIGDLSRSLSNIDLRHCVSTEHASDAFRSIAQIAPVVVYEHFKSLADSASVSPESDHCWLVARVVPPFGRFPDSAYLDKEIAEQWRLAIDREPCREGHIALASRLLYSDPDEAPRRLHQLATLSSKAVELEITAQLANATIPRFAFTQSKLVQLLVVRAKELNTSSEVDRILLEAARLGGSRGWTDGQLNPEYRHILEQAELLAARFRDDLLLGPFYSSIASAERQSQEWHRKMFPEDQSHEESL